MLGDGLRDGIRIAGRRRYSLGILLLAFLIGFLMGSLAIYASVQSKLISVGGVMPSVELTFVYGSEKRGWVEEVKSGFELWFESNFFIDVKCNFIAMGSRESVMQIVNEQLHPVAWSPASSIWIPYLNEKWRETHGGVIADEKIRPLVISPIILATWNSSFYQQHPFRGIKDLIDIAASDPDGGDGVLKYGHTNPHLSNSGTMIVLLEFAAAAGKEPSELTIFDLANPIIQGRVRTLEAEAIQYGESTGFFGDWAVEGGPNTITVFAVYESVVIAKSRTAMQVWGDALIAIYPEEGVLLSDHPFVILNAPWVSPLQVFAAEKLYEYLMQPEVQKAAQKYGFRPANPDVPLDPSIFSPERGVSPEIPSKLLSPPPGLVLEYAVMAWDAVRNRGVK
ncbi:MAG: extracellular solute-binding protein [Candidatus Freyarchaeota archaeon]|nr:extracellular solute-binding protein [Candidatus Jordarchaeia archaeon]